MNISPDEFQRWMQVLRDDIQGVNTRLDVLTGRTRDAEQKIAVLESQGKTDPIARWGAAIGAAAAGALGWFK